MSDVFVSYKRENLVKVGALVEALRGEGVKVWWQRAGRRGRCPKGRR
jgi:hypothetical protein